MKGKKKKKKCKSEGKNRYNWKKQGKQSRHGQFKGPSTKKKKKQFTREGNLPKEERKKATKHVRKVKKRKPRRGVGDSVPTKKY